MRCTAFYLSISTLGPQQGYTGEQQRDMDWDERWCIPKVFSTALSCLSFSFISFLFSLFPQCLVFTCEKHVHRTCHAFMLLLVKVIPLSRCNGYVCKRCDIYVDLLLLASSIQVI